MRWILLLVFVAGQCFVASVAQTDVTVAETETVVMTVTGTTAVQTDASTSDADETITTTVIDGTDSTTIRGEGNSAATTDASIKTTDGSGTTTTVAGVTQTSTAKDIGTTARVETDTAGASTANAVITEAPTTREDGATEITTGGGEITTATYGDQTTIPPVLTTLGCQLSSDSCKNEGTFDKEFCECICPVGFTGTMCEVPPDENPCMKDPDPCKEEGKYCESDPKGKNFTCLCRIADGYLDDGTGSCEKKKAFTSQLHVTQINGKESKYEDAYQNPRSKASQALFDIVIPVIEDALSKNDATKTVDEVEGISIERGSVIVETAAFFPVDDKVSSSNIEGVLKEENLGNGSSSLALDPDKFSVKVSSTDCPSDLCSNAGKCEKTGTYPAIKHECRCTESFTGPKCESLVHEAFTPFVIAMIVFGGFALVLAAAVFVFWMAVKRRQTTGEEKRGKRRLSGDETTPNHYGTTNQAFDDVENSSGHSGSHLYYASPEEERSMSRLADVMSQSIFRPQNGRSAYDWVDRPQARKKSHSRYTETPFGIELSESIEERRRRSAYNM